MTSGMTTLLVLARTGGDDSEQRTRSKQSCLPRRTIMTRSREGYGSLAVRYVGMLYQRRKPGNPKTLRCCDSSCTEYSVH